MGNLRLPARLVAALLIGMAIAGNGIAKDNATDPRVAPFVHHDTLSDLQYSPDGTHIAGITRRGNTTGVIVMRLADGKTTLNMRLPNNNQVIGVEWVNRERLLVSIGRNIDGEIKPTATGELYGVNLDGTKQALLAGYRVSGAAVGTRIGGSAKEEYSAVYLLDSLPDNDDEALVYVWPYESRDPLARVDRMNVYSGRRVTEVLAPMPRARFMTDTASRVRFARASTDDNLSKLYHRKAEGGEWTLVSDEAKLGHLESPLGFASGDRIAYLQVEQENGPDTVVAYDTLSGERRTVASDAKFDPVPIYRDGSFEMIGVRFGAEGARIVYFDPNAPAAVQHAKLQAAFPDNLMSIASSTRDGNRKLLFVRSDVDPGSYYGFDAVTRKADFLSARQKLIDPEAMRPRKAFSFKARDGMELHGFLTLPAKPGRAPLVVMPHGGPFGIHDSWGFDNDVQLLASAGYAVLQLNYRGSSNHGKAYMHAGAREWGGKMQDDLTDATRWAFQNPAIDPSRACIYGASYGGYAALMGVAKEPALYKCAVGAVGVYDLNMMIRDDTDVGNKSARTWFREWVGDDSARLQATSPTYLAGSIKVPVLIAWAGGDDIAPSRQSRAMVSALKRAQVPVETVYFAKEGHGFYSAENQAQFYTRLLAFLGQHLGNAPAQ